ncbi:MAG: family 43 glycosylhydrolase, partial [Oscillospiraceae bacterium]|nr:family 43 glycosylhydrolase [Oscillospiraceae bacterium]
MKKFLMTGLVFCMLTACSSGGGPESTNHASATPPAAVTPEPSVPPAAGPEELPPAAPGAGFAFDDAPPPVFADVSVHDPSVFPADGGFYVIGSHLAAARTTDFMSWTQVTRDWRGRSNVFYPADHPDPGVQTMEEQSADVLRGAENALGFFAGDIHRMPDGRFFQYYCLTASWKCSAIGLAVSDTGPEGPYVTQGLLVRSAMAGENKTPDGEDTWTERRYPNCIDPQAFFDQDGNFRMVYGSWSGGIFLLDLDPHTGLLLDGSEINRENHGYGRLLIAGAHASIEGPYILYSPDSGYYYLFVSYGGLASGGGYNIRVFRSRGAEGPYEDSVHTDIA